MTIDLSFYRGHFRATAVQHIHHAAETLRRAAADLDRYAAQIDLREKDSDAYACNARDAAYRCQWAINECASNVLTNCRLDLMAQDMADLQRLHHVETGGDL